MLTHTLPPIPTLPSLSLPAQGPNGSTVEIKAIREGKNGLQRQKSQNVEFTVVLTRCKLDPFNSETTNQNRHPKEKQPSPRVWTCLRLLKAFTQACVHVLLLDQPCLRYMGSRYECMFVMWHVCAQSPAEATAGGPEPETNTREWHDLPAPSPAAVCFCRVRAAY